MSTSPNIVPCTSCGAKNRLAAPDSKTASAASSPGEQKLPTCGRCKEPLPWLVDSSDADFQQAVDAPVPVLADFWAPWCGPCRRVGPVLAELARENAGRLKVVKVNVDQNPQVAQAFRAQSIPLLVLLSGGKEVDRFVGAMPKGALAQKISPYLA